MKFISETLTAADKNGELHRICVNEKGLIGVETAAGFEHIEPRYTDNGTKAKAKACYGEITLLSTNNDVMRDVHFARKKATEMFEADQVKKADAEIEKMIEQGVSVTAIHYRLDAVMISGQYPEHVSKRIARAVRLVDSNKKAINWQTSNDDDYPTAQVNLSEIMPIARGIEQALEADNKQAQAEGFRNASHKAVVEEEIFQQNHDL